MRCFACQKNLNDFESTLKDGNGDYLDGCLKCLRGLGIETHGREDLMPNEEAPEDFFDVGDTYDNYMDDPMFLDAN